MKPMKDVLPKQAQWLNDNVTSFLPNENKVKTGNGDIVQYEIMIVAMGLQLYWDKVDLFIFKVISLIDNSFNF